MICTLLYCKAMCKNSVIKIKYLGGLYSKHDIYTAVLHNTKTRPHVDCEMIDDQQFIKVNLKLLSPYK